MKKSKGKQDDDFVILYNILPFPQRLWQSKETKRESRFKNMLINLEIFMLFMDVETQF